MIIAPQTSSTI